MCFGITESMSGNTNFSSVFTAVRRFLTGFHGCFTTLNCCFTKYFVVLTAVEVCFDAVQVKVYAVKVKNTGVFRLNMPSYGTEVVQ